MLSIIVAIAENHAIGHENRLLYRLPDDLKRFKSLTTGHTVIMGRRTFESLPKGALPNRRNIVLSHTRTEPYPGTELYPGLQEALAHCTSDEAVFIIGGESVYAEALPLADRLYLTEIADTPEQADAFFPPFDRNEWALVRSEIHKPDERHAVPFAFNDYERKQQLPQRHD